MHENTLCMPGNMIQSQQQGGDAGHWAPSGYATRGSVGGDFLPRRPFQQSRDSPMLVYSPSLSLEIPLYRDTETQATFTELLQHGTSIMAITDTQANSGLVESQTPRKCPD